MNNSNDESDLMWASINVLQSTLKQGFSFNSIVNNYKFILILTKLLKEQYPMDKKIIVLKLLQVNTINKIKIMCLKYFFKLKGFDIWSKIRMARKLFI